MGNYPKFLAAIVGSFLSLVTIDVNSAQAGSFTFTSIVNSRDNQNFSFIRPFDAINDNGTVAFAASSPTPGIFTSNGGAITTAVYPLPEYSYNIFGLAINNSGKVAFANLSSFPQEGLFIGNGENVTTVVTPSDGLFVTTLSPGAFNDNGTLVFSLLKDFGNNGSIAIGNGGPLTTVADTNGIFSFFNQPPVINDANVVAFQANLKDGRTGVFTIKDGSVTTIVDNTNPSFDGFGEVGINNQGTVVFTAALGDGVDGIFTGDGETITAIADTSGLFSQLFRPAINDNNEVVFGAILDGGSENGLAYGIFTGADPVADKVIGVGDSLLGGTVTNVFLSGSLNNSGQISFYAEILDESGRTINGIFRADPVLKSIPESSSTLGLLALGTLGISVGFKGKGKYIRILLNENKAQG